MAGVDKSEDLPEGKVIHRLSVMENNLPDAHNPRSNAADALRNLESDRAGLVERLRAPKWFAPALGALAAVYIASPALPEALNRGFVGTPVIVVGILLVLGYQRSTGIKLLRFRVFELVLFAGAVATTLLFFSVSLGLAAGGLHGWIAASAVVGFLAVTALAALGASSMRERVRDVA